MNEFRCCFVSQKTKLNAMAVYRRGTAGNFHGNDLLRSGGGSRPARIRSKGLIVDAKHRMRELPEQRRSLNDHGGRRSVSGIAAICEVLSGSLVCAASVMALVLNGPQPERRTVAAIQEPAPAAQSVSQEGTLIAVSAGSVTARSANGYTQTYLVTPNTTVITDSGSQPATSATYFTVNDRVVVVGRMQGGRALATTVADRDAGHGGGPPMDCLDGQPLPPDTT